MRIADVKAYPTSFPIPPANRVALGIGTAVRRDAVLIKVTTDGGLVGWGEAHHGRAHTAVAKLIETTLRQLILGMDADDVVGVWGKMYRFQLASHGMGAGACLAMSGIDTALWDIRGKALGVPLYKLLGGKRKTIPAWRTRSRRTITAATGKRNPAGARPSPRERTITLASSSPA